MEENTVTYWLERIKAGQEFQKEVAKSDDWKKYKDYYRHNYNTHELPVNLIFSHLRTLIPQIYFKDPRVSITPQNPNSIMYAQILEKVNNALIRTMGIKKHIKKMILDAGLCGVGHGLHGYDSQYGYDNKLIDVRMKGLGTASCFDEKGNRIEYNRYVQPGMPWFNKINPEDVIFPYGCDDVTNADFVAIRHIRRLDDVKKDPKYTNTKNLVGNTKITRTDEDSTPSVDQLSNIDRNTVEYVELWEIRDFKKNKIRVIATGHDKYLRDDNDLNIKPIKSLIFNDDPEFCYGVPDVRLIESHQREINEIRKQIQAHRKLSLIKFLVAKQAIGSKENVENLLDGNIRAIMVEGDNVGNVIRDVQHATPPDLYNQMQEIYEETRYMLGVNRNQSGEFQGKTHITKEEVKTVGQNAYIRIDERRDQVADLLTDIVKDNTNLLFDYWDGPRITDIVGPDGGKFWVEYTGPELRGEYNYKIDPNETVATSPQSRKEDAMQMMNAWGSVLTPLGSPPPMELMKFYFRQFDDGAGMNMEAAVSEFQQQMQMMQQMKQADGTGASPEKPAPIGDVLRGMKGKQPNKGGQK